MGQMLSGEEGGERWFRVWKRRAKNLCLTGVDDLMTSGGTRSGQREPQVPHYRQGTSLYSQQWKLAS